MRRNSSGQLGIRGLLIALALFVWCIKIPEIIHNNDTLFCYTRDGYGNKALIRNDGTVYVEDTFIMEIPTESWKLKESVTLTVIMEDEDGNKKTKRIRLNEIKP